MPAHQARRNEELDADRRDSARGRRRALPLGLQPLGQPHERRERGLDGATKITAMPRRNRGAGSSHRRGASEHALDQARRQPRAPPQPILHRAMSPGRARDRSPEGATGHAGPESAVRWPRNAPLPGPGERRRPGDAEIAQVAGPIPGRGPGRKRQHVRRLVDAPRLPVQGPHRRVGDDDGHRRRPRARRGPRPQPGREPRSRGPVARPRR